ncbi:hypothetical protein GCM10009760_00300 [Kitasatospora kazusensis]|uniref:M23ase beta-sheet core domain-containing protein n=2 Tax=Kitasatospora kazusensis TaxID=407974 RepID=A0ABN2YLR4_9ACTN
MTLAFGALLIPVSASAQTVRPTAPGGSVFTAALASPPASAEAAAGDAAAGTGAAREGASGATTVGKRARPGKAVTGSLVQIATPIAYQLPSSASPQDAVAVARDLAPATPAAPPPAPARAAEPAPAPAPPPAWYAPAPGAPITNPYGVPNAEYAAGYHTGVDFAVDSGTPLHAVGDATVVSAGWAGAYGKEVVLLLPDDHYAQYAHLSSLSVSAGDTVAAGQEIGQSGSTGNSTGPHLHFEIRTSNHYGAVVDPIGYLSEHGATDF